MLSGGIITEADLSAYKPLTKPAVSVKLADLEYSLHTVPPPGSGLILTLILNILKNYNMTSNDFKDIDRAAIMYHRISEAFKFAFAHRTQMGDAAFVNLTQVCKYLLIFALAVDFLYKPDIFYYFFETILVILRERKRVEARSPTHWFMYKGVSDCFWCSQTENYKMNQVVGCIIHDVAKLSTNIRLSW